MNIPNKIKEYQDQITDLTKSISEYNIDKIILYIKQIPNMCKMNIESARNRKSRNEHTKKYHPIRVHKGDIYNANISENVGSELSDNHLVIIVQGFSSNVYGEKVTIIPIEGDGYKINPHYQIKLTNDDLKEGHLDKNPSRAIFTDITTLDKARLDGKVGSLKPEKLEEINSNLAKHLDLKIYSKQNKSSVLTK